MTFYRAYPFDDYHRYFRPSALVAQSMAGGSLQEKLDWLQPPTWQQDFSDSDLKTLQTFGLRK